MHQQMITFMGRYGVGDQVDQVPTHFSVKPTKKSAIDHVVVWLLSTSLAHGMCFVAIFNTTYSEWIYMPTLPKDKSVKYKRVHAMTIYIYLI